MWRTGVCVNQQCGKRRRHSVWDAPGPVCGCDFAWSSLSLAFLNTPLFLVLGRLAPGPSRWRPFFNTDGRKNLERFWRSLCDRLTRSKKERELKRKRLLNFC
ncbi:hypothetical protein PoB_001361000 [Plakobranchus ocellatus]|uniref:Uncharacterized protein n=1 Tax=Plakobranchus ocellatus TaxID=259542 RepID=A0AAV3YW32_9GAST|nr:hypothetical protein PoB_001361000 [Plakobranchus ocellatus]